MIEDKLEHDERLRLECLAQAINYAARDAACRDVVKKAREFEAYVSGKDE